MEDILNKQKAIIAWLENLAWYWEPAKWLLSLLKSSSASPELIEMIYSILIEATKTLNDTQEKNRLELSIKMIDEMRKKEDEENIKTVQEISEIQFI